MPKQILVSFPILTVGDGIMSIDSSFTYEFSDKLNKLTLLVSWTWAIISEKLPTNNLFPILFKAKELPNLEEILVPLITWRWFQFELINSKTVIKLVSDVGPPQFSW